MDNDEPFIEEVEETANGIAHTLWLDNGDGTKKLIKRDAILIGKVSLRGPNGELYEGGSLFLMPPNGLEKFEIIDIPGIDSPDSE